MKISTLFPIAVLVTCCPAKTILVASAQKNVHRKASTKLVNADASKRISRKEIKFFAKSWTKAYKKAYKNKDFIISNVQIEKQHYHPAGDDNNRRLGNKYNSLSYFYFELLIDGRCNLCKNDHLDQGRPLRVSKEFGKLLCKFLKRSRFGPFRSLTECDVLFE